jgi:hypothetical protein
VSHKKWLIDICEYGMYWYICMLVLRMQSFGRLERTGAYLRNNHGMHKMEEVYGGGGKCCMAIDENTASTSYCRTLFRMEAQGMYDSMSRKNRTKSSQRILVFTHTPSSGASTNSWQLCSIDPDDMGRPHNKDSSCHFQGWGGLFIVG